MNALLHAIAHALGRYPDQTSVLNIILALEIRLMSKLDELKSEVAEYHGNVVAKIGELKDQIAALQNQPGGVTDADLQGVIDTINGFEAELKPAPVEVVAEEPVPAAPEAPVEPAA